MKIHYASIDIDIPISDLNFILSDQSERSILAFCCLLLHVLLFLRHEGMKLINNLKVV